MRIRKLGQGHRFAEPAITIGDMVHETVTGGDYLGGYMVSNAPVGAVTYTAKNLGV